MTNNNLPPASPKRKEIQQIMSSPTKSSVTYDRFIPDRTNLNYSTVYQLNKEKNKTKKEMDAMKDEANKVYENVLKNELFGPETTTTLGSPSKILQFKPKEPFKSRRLDFGTPNLFKSHSIAPPHLASSTSTQSSNNTPLKHGESPHHAKFATSPIHPSTYKHLLSPRKQPRHISKIPFKVLDAPDLADDFYLNLVDWGSTNVLAVGLGSCVYLWSACTSRVMKLCEIGPYDSVASVNWIQRGSHLAVGTNRGLVQIWDIAKFKKVRAMTGHTARVGICLQSSLGTLAWNDYTLTSGSRDRYILHRDVRCQEHFIKKLSGHKQEVCGIKWNCEDNQLASGGNDNRLLIWDKMNEQPTFKFADHVAAVKALSWSPHQHGLLASGGGTADRKIRFWNTLTGTPLNSVDTGSQVCNLAWSKTANEIVSTHGYSQNQIMVWKYPSMEQLATLTGHTYRVLYLAMSPDGQTIVTGAGDETLRFWNVFTKRSEKLDKESVVMTGSRSIR